MLFGQQQIRNSKVNRQKTLSGSPDRTDRFLFFFNSAKSRVFVAPKDAAFSEPKMKKNSGEWIPRVYFYFTVGSVFHCRIKNNSLDFLWQTFKMSIYINIKI